MHRMRSTFVRDDSPFRARYLAALFASCLPSVHISALLSAVLIGLPLWVASAARAGLSSPVRETGPASARMSCDIDEDCDDGNPCVVNVCISGTCEGWPAQNGLPCNDLHTCTIDDECFDGFCVGQDINGEYCTDDPDCTPAGSCVDSACECEVALAACCMATACTIADQFACDDADGFFLGLPNVDPPILECDPSPCATGACCAVPGGCVDEVGGAPLTQQDCDDLGGAYVGGADCGNVARPEDCVNGADDDCDGFTDCADSDCASHPDCAGIDCIRDADCDDGDPCTVDICDLQSYLCTRTEVHEFSCDDDGDCFGGKCAYDGFCRCANVPPGDNCWRTPCGRTQFNFCDRPIPPDFFGSGSEQFDGVVRLGGSGGEPDGDTRLARIEPMALEFPGDEDETPIELVQLELVSCEPVTVVINGGDTQWDVEVTLSATAPPAGVMTVSKTHENGGVFESVFSMQPLFTFTEIGNPDNVRVLDTADPPFSLPPLVLKTIGSPHWVHEARAGITIDPVCGTDFIPGVAEDPLTLEQCCEPTGHAAAGFIHVTGAKCEPCPRGACCFLDGACVVTEATDTMSAEEACFFLDLAQEFKGDGTDCADSDGDGIADWLETSDCCAGDRDRCNTGTDPNNPDTDGDGTSDGDELDAGTDPCVPDEGCPQVEPPNPEANPVAKNRYISFVPGNPARQTALRVTLADLPAPFDAFDGTVMWIGPPRDISELSAGSGGTPAPTFKGANLQCAPHCMDWGALGLLDVFDDEIVPSAVYDVQAIDCDCDPDVEEDYSLPLTIATARWGDVTGDCGVTPCSPPDGAVDFIDIAALVDKFKNSPGAPVKSRTDLAGDVPDAVIDFLDISLDVDAFKAAGYPPAVFDGPEGCP